MAFHADPFALFEVADNVFNVMDIITVLVLSTALALVIAKVYQYTHDTVSYSKNFVQIMVVFGVVVSMIMLIIGSNIARAFTLLGALSIVRFRNAVKETRDVGFIFLMMAVGMAVGTRFYALAILMTLFISLLIVVMFTSNFGSSSKKEELLKVIVPSKFSIEKTFSKIFSDYLLNHQFLSTESTGRKGFNRAVFIVKFKDYNRKNEFVDELREITKNDVYLTETDYLVH